MPESRLTRDLLDANLALTSQLVELARMVIGAPAVAAVERAPMQAGPVPAFEMSTEDDWDDTPEVPMGELLTLIPKGNPRAITDDLPLHMTEEEEDIRYSVGVGNEPPKALSDFLKVLKAPNTAVVIEPLA